MAPDGSSGDLRLTQDASKGSSMPLQHEQAAEKRHCRPEAVINISKDSHVYDSADASVGNPLTTHGSPLKQKSAAMPHVAVFLGNAPNSSAPDVAFCEPRYYQHMEEQSEISSKYLRELAAAPPSPLDTSSRCPPSAPFYVASHQLPSDVNGALSQLGWSTAVAPSRADLLSFPTPGAEGLLHGVHAPPSFTAPASEGIPLSPSTDAPMRQVPVWYSPDDRTGEPFLWHQRGTTNAPPRTLLRVCNGGPTPNLNTLTEIWKKPFQVASQESCGVHLNDVAEDPSHNVSFADSQSPEPAACCATPVDVESDRGRPGEQTLATVAGMCAGSEEATTQRQREAHNSKKPTPLGDPPITSPAPPHGCLSGLDSPDAEEDAGILGLCWSVIADENESGKSGVQELAGETVQQCRCVGERRILGDAADLQTQQQVCDNYFTRADARSPERTHVHRVALSGTALQSNRTEQISAFIAAQHSFLASGQLFEECGTLAAARNCAKEVSLQFFCGQHKERQQFATAHLGLFQPAFVPPGAPGDSREYCAARCNEEKTETLMHGENTNIATLMALASGGDHPGRPFHASTGCSERASYCSGITAAGSEFSSYGGTTLGRSASHISCKAGAPGCSTAPTVMVAPSSTLQDTGTEKDQPAACISLVASCRTSAASRTDVVARGTVPDRAAYMAAAETMASPTTAILKNERLRNSAEASEFETLVRAFYANDSRHSVLWDESRGGVPPYETETPCQLTAQREDWTAAAGIVQVMQQVKALIKRLRGLQLVTHELAAVPDASGALCCCLSGSLTEYGEGTGSTAPDAPAQWKFEQLLVLSMQDNGSADGSQRKDAEQAAAGTSDTSGDFSRGLHGFQIQDEVFVVSPVFKSQAPCSKAVATVPPAETPGSKRTHDAPSMEGTEGGSPVLAHLHSTSAEHSYRSPAGRGWTAVLRWTGQRGVRDWAGVYNSGRNHRNSLRSSCLEERALAPQHPAHAASAGKETVSATNEEAAASGSAIRRNRGRARGEDMAGERSGSFCQPAGHPTAASKGSFTSKRQHPPTAQVQDDSATLRVRWPGNCGEFKHIIGTPAPEVLASEGAGTGTIASTCQVVRSEQLAARRTVMGGEQQEDPLCREGAQTYAKQSIRKYQHACLAPGDVQCDTSPTRKGLKTRSKSGIGQATLPAYAALPPAADVPQNELVNALLQCQQELDIRDDTSSSFELERAPVAPADTLAEATLTGARSQEYVFSRARKGGCYPEPAGPSCDVGLPPAAGSRHNVDARLETLFDKPSQIQRADEAFSADIPALREADDTGRTPPKSTSGKHGGRKRNCGGKAAEAGVSRDRVPRRRSPRADVKKRSERRESGRGVEEDLQSLGFFREHCTVFVSWVPRAARADDFRQKTSMEMRLKVLLQMAMGVRGIDRVALFPPRGSHCCVLFESPAAASAFIHEYGGPTYTSTTEQFKADICAAYAVALDRGIERVFIRIEEFKPHVLQQHILEAGDRSTPAVREWHERRGDCATACHQLPGGRWRQHQMPTSRDRGKKSTRYRPLAPMTQPSQSSPSSHAIQGAETTAGESSALQRLWQLQERSPRSCSAHMPAFRQ